LGTLGQCMVAATYFYCLDRFRARGTLMCPEIFSLAMGAVDRARRLASRQRANASEALRSARAVPPRFGLPAIAREISRFVRRIST
jgi:hypothetical protein